MTKHINLKAIFLLLIALVAISILAGSLSNLELKPGIKYISPERHGDSDPDTDGLFFGGSRGTTPLWLIILFFTSIGAGVIYLFIKGYNDLKAISPGLIVFLLLILLIFAIMAILHYFFGSTTSHAPEKEMIVSQEPIVVTLTNMNIPSWLIYLLLFGGLSALLGVLAYIGFFYRRSKNVSRKGTMISLEALHAADALAAGHNTRETIIQCYQKMVTIFSEQKEVHRHTSMTAREFEIHLGTVGFSEKSVSRLTRLFERIRYSTEESGDLENQEAIACLKAIAEHHTSKDKNE
jgi:uncharacterized protein DUF4129